MVFSFALTLSLQGASSPGAQIFVLLILLLTQGSNISSGEGTDKGYDLPSITL